MENNFSSFGPVERAPQPSIRTAAAPGPAGAWVRSRAGLEPTREARSGRGSIRASAGLGPTRGWGRGPRGIAQRLLRGPWLHAGVLLRATRDADPVLPGTTLGWPRPRWHHPPYNVRPGWIRTPVGLDPAGARSGSGPIRTPGTPRPPGVGLVAWLATRRRPGRPPAR